MITFVPRSIGFMSLFRCVVVGWLHVPHFESPTKSTLFLGIVFNSEFPFNFERQVIDHRIFAIAF